MNAYRMKCFLYDEALTNSLKRYRMRRNVTKLRPSWLCAWPSYRRPIADRQLIHSYPHCYCKTDQVRVKVTLLVV